MNLSQAQNWIRVDVFFCLRPIQCPITEQGGCRHLNSLIPISWWYWKDFQIFIFWILGYLQIFCVSDPNVLPLSSMMPWTISHICILVLWASIANFGRFWMRANFSCKFWKTFVVYSLFVISMLQSSRLELFSCVCVPRTGFLEPEEPPSCPGSSELSWFRIPRTGFPESEESTSSRESAKNGLSSVLLRSDCP